MKRERYFRDELWRMFAIYAILPAVLFTFFCGILFMAVLLHGRERANRDYLAYVTGRVKQTVDAKWRLDNMHETYLQDMNSKYVYPNVFMSIDDTNKVSQYDTDIKKYAEQKKADWILNGGCPGISSLHLLSLLHFQDR